MKRKMKYGTIIAVVIVGLMIASAFTSMATRTTPSFSDEKDQKYYQLLQQAPSLGLKLVETARVQDTAVYQTTAVKKATSEMQTSIVAAEGDTYGGNLGRDETSLVDHPTISDNGNTLGDNIVIGFHIVANDTLADTVVFQGADGYGANWGNEYVEKYWQGHQGYNTPRKWDFPSIDYWGIEDAPYNDQWFGSVWEKDYVGSPWFESGLVNIIRICNDPTNLQVNNGWNVRRWNWSASAQGNMRNMKWPSMACAELEFPTNNTHWVFNAQGVYQAIGGEPFGLLSYVVGSHDTVLADTGHFCHPIEYYVGQTYPPSGPGENRYMLMHWWNAAGGCTGTSADIDVVTEAGFAAWDPVNVTRAQHDALFYGVNDMNLRLYYDDSTEGSHPDLVEAGWSHYMNDRHLDIQYPSIAAGDGAVVCANELNNDTGAGEQYLMLWYDTSYTGDVGENFTISGLWYNLDGAKFKQPKVSHYEGKTFIMTVIIDQPVGTDDELGFAVSYDGGANWGPTGSIYLFKMSDAESIPLLGANTIDCGENTYIWTYEQDMDHTGFYYNYMTRWITGNVVNFLEQPVEGATVDVYNKDRGNANGYAARLPPVKTDANGDFNKKCLVSIELWNGANCSIIVSKDVNVGIIENIVWNPISWFNNAGEIPIDIHYRDLVDFPFYWAYDVNAQSEYEVTNTGAAVAQMMLNYVWWNKNTDVLPPLYYDNQFTIFDNFDTDLSGSIDGWEMAAGLNTYKPLPIQTYGYFWNPVHNADLNHVLQSVCVWIDYNMSFYMPNWPAPGHVYHVPVAMPFHGTYDDWVAVRGIHTDVDAWAAYPSMPDVTVYGFWINDPKFDDSTQAEYYGMPGKTYMTYATFVDNLAPIAGEYEAIVEPPEGLDLEQFEMNRVTQGKMTEKFTNFEMKLAARGGISGSTVIVKQAKDQIQQVFQMENPELYDAFENVNGQAKRVKGGFMVTFSDVVTSAFLNTNGELAWFNLV